MKRSTMFLVAALVVPAAITTAGLVAGVKRLKPLKGSDPMSGSSLNHLFERIEGTLPLVQEQSLALNGSLSIEASASQVDIHFDDSLRGTAQVKVESSTPGLAAIQLSTEQITFEPKEGGAPLRVTLRLPTSFKSLKLSVAASRLEVASEKGLNVDDFNIHSDASHSHFALSELKTKVFNGDINAGNIDISAALLSAESLTWTAQASQMQWDIRRMAFVGKDKKGLRVDASAGNVDISIDESQQFAVNASSTMGNLVMQRGNETVSLSGLSQEDHLEAPEGAPLIELGVNMGNLTFKVETITP